MHSIVGSHREFVNRGDVLNASNVSEVGNLAYLRGVVDDSLEIVIDRQITDDRVNLALEAEFLASIDRSGESGFVDIRRRDGEPVSGGREGRRAADSRSGPGDETDVLPGEGVVLDRVNVLR